MTDFLSDLNEPQRQAAQIIHGPLLILAGAGSGKTRTLTYRIAHLLVKGYASPEEILAVTFTNKAAKEMRHRVEALLGNTIKAPADLSTFHALGAKILREQGAWHDRSKGFAILNSGDSEKLMREAMDRLHVPRKELPIGLISKAISQAKNSRVLPGVLSATAQMPRARMIAEVYREYEKLLKQQVAFDFDDLLLKTVELLERQKDLQTIYQARWRFVSVDEYQDTNILQEQLLQLLVGPEKNLCVVGDDYQAIYSWRGAKVDHILRFEKTYPQAQTIYLTQNYRSTPEILAAANAVIAQNTVQKHKKLWTAQKGGSNVTVWGLPSERAESKFVREQIEAHVRQGERLSDCVVLYRTNAQSRIFEEEFLTHRLPYTIVGGFKFYDRREVKDALAFLTLSLNPNSLLAFGRVAGALMPGVGPKTIAKWSEGSAAAGKSLVEYISGATQKASVVRIVQAISGAQGQTWLKTSDLLQHLLVSTSYLKELKKLPDFEEREENITELLNVASAYEDPVKFLEDVALLSDIDTLEDQQDRITCMTLHGVKGLEYLRVFLVGCEEGLLPHGNAAFEAAQLEEERRLLYVGMTRARESLTITFVGGRYIHGTFSPQAPSRFLEDLPDEVVWNRYDEVAPQTAWQDPLYQEQTISIDASPMPEFDLRPQMIVSHPVFGMGVIISQANNKAMCIFEGHGVKTVAANVLTLP